MVGIAAGGTTPSCTEPWITPQHWSLAIAMACVLADQAAAIMIDIRLLTGPNCSPAQRG